jgi:hypothetical protein
VAVTGFPDEARRSLGDSQLRANLARATSTIRDKRGRVVDELPDWEALRAAGAAIKDSALLRLDEHLTDLESALQARGGTVHWAKDGGEACSIVAEIARGHSLDEVVKVKSIATDEIGLNEQLAASGIHAVETDLAELIIQLDADFPSHILVPAIHRNRAEIRDIFRRELGLDDLTDEPAALAEAARLHLRRKFLSARMGVSGANFAVAETGSVCVFESEGNGRMCTTLPEVLVTVMGIEKVIPSWRDMEVFLQLLPRSSTGERLNPYTSVWSGAAEDGPREFHLVLVDNGRVQTLADELGRPALQRMPERVPRVRARGRARLRLGLPRPDRSDPDAAARGHRRKRAGSVTILRPGLVRPRGLLIPRGVLRIGLLRPCGRLAGACGIAALRLLAVRGLRRGLSGQDRDSPPPDPPARPRGGGTPAARPRKGHDARPLPHLLNTRALRASTEARTWSRASAGTRESDDLTGTRPARRLDDFARAPDARTRDLPRVVAPHPRPGSPQRRDLHPRPVGFAGANRVALNSA